MVLPGSDPTEEGADVCPAIRGATNWWATCYHPWTKLFNLLAHKWIPEARRPADKAPTREHRLLVGRT